MVDIIIQAARGNKRRAGAGRVYTGLRPAGNTGRVYIEWPGRGFLGEAVAGGSWVYIV